MFLFQTLCLFFVMGVERKRPFLSKDLYNDCWKVAANDVTVQPTNVEMIQYNYYIFLIVLKYYT